MDGWDGMGWDGTDGWKEYRPIRPKYPPLLNPRPLVKSDFQNTVFSNFQNPPARVDFQKSVLNTPPPLVKSQKNYRGGI